jgi:hypothetical protein
MVKVLSEEILKSLKRIEVYLDEILYVMTVINSVETSNHQKRLKIRLDEIT